MAMIETNGTRLRYRFDGPENAPVLLFSNSLCTRLEMWDEQARAFAGPYRVLRYDKRGHGESDVPPGPYDFDMLSRDVLGLLDGLGLDKVDYCGLSMGGMSGQWLAANAPERFGKMVFANTASAIGPASIWEERMALARQGGMEGVCEATIERWFTQDFRAEGGEALDKVRAMISSTPLEGYVACCEALRDMDLRDLLPRIQVPVLVIIGAEDPATTPELGNYIADNIAGAQRHVIEGVAHLSNVQAPAEFTRAVSAFLLNQADFPIS